MVLFVCAVQKNFLKNLEKTLSDGEKMPLGMPLVFINLFVCAVQKSQCDYNAQV